MYPEFIPIYAGIAVIIVLLIVILCVVIKRTSNSAPNQRWMPPNQGGFQGGYQGGFQGGYQGDEGTIVFCKNCTTKFSSLQKNCPKCGMPR